MAKVGVKPKLTPEVQAEICKNLASGCHKSIAAACAGIGSRTFSTWMAKGKGHRTTRYGKFRLAVLAAEKTAELTLAAAACKNAMTDGRIALEYLARRHPKRWAKRDHLELSTKAGRPIEVSTDEARADIERQLARLAAVAAAAGVPEGEGPEGTTH